MNPTVKLLLAGTAILALPLSAQTTIFSDDFSSGSSPGNGWTTSSAAPWTVTRPIIFRHGRFRR